MLEICENCPFSNQLSTDIDAASEAVAENKQLANAEHEKIAQKVSAFRSLDPATIGLVNYVDLCTELDCQVEDATDAITAAYDASDLFETAITEANNTDCIAAGIAPNVCPRATAVARHMIEIISISTQCRWSE